MKTIKKLILTAILTMPAITNAALFTDAETTSPDQFRSGILKKVAYLRTEHLKKTIEFENLCKTWVNMIYGSGSLKETMQAASAIEKLTRGQAPAKATKNP